MREIKFRAWDKLEKRMRKVVSLHWQDEVRLRLSVISIRTLNCWRRNEIQASKRHAYLWRQWK